MSNPFSLPVSSRRWLGAFCVVAAVMLAYPLCKRGLILSDEGYLLMQGWDMLQGRVLYSSLDAFVTPGVWFLLAGLFAIAEPTVYVTRLAALAGFGCIVATVYRSVARDASPTYAIGSSIALVIAVVWAFPAWTFSFYSPYSILFALLGFERLVNWDSSGRRFDLFTAGLCFGISILFKQNYGVFATLGGLCAYAALLSGKDLEDRTRSVPRDAYSVLAGGLVAAVPLLGYVLYHGVFDEAYHALVVQPFSDFAQHHTIRYLGPSDMLGDTALVGTQRLTYGSYPLANTPSMRVASSLTLSFVKRLHVFLYLWPLILFGLATYEVARKRRITGDLDRRLLAALLFCAFVFLGVLPRADSNHLMHVYQPIILLSALVFHRLLSSDHSQLVHRIALATAVSLLLSYGATGMVWYKGLVSSLTTPVAGRGGGVLVDLFTGSMLNRELELIAESTEPGEPLLTGPGLAMLNFLADRPMPSRYYNMYAVHVGHDDGRGVVEASRNADVKTAVIEYNNFYSDPEGLRDFAPELATYLREDFEIMFTVGQNQHAFLRKRARVDDHLQRRDLLANCDDTKFFVDGRTVQEHTMFRSLYLRAPINPREDAENRVNCTVDIPPDARLRFNLDYTRPAEIQEDARLHAQIWVHPLAGDEEDGGMIFGQAIAPFPADGWTLDPPVEMEVDLSRFSGRSVRVELRTWASGDIKRSSFVVAGLTTIWMDPVIVWAIEDLAENPRHDGVIK